MTSVVSAANANPARIRPLTPADVPKAAATLYESFGTDALAKLLTNHIVDPAHRRKVDLKLYECYLRQHLEKGICLGIGEGATCFETVAIWSHPSSLDEGLDSFAHLMDSGYAQLYDICGAEGQSKIFKGMLPLLHDTCERILALDPGLKDRGVYTLVYLGLVQAARGKGNVRAMFEYMFARYIDLPGSNNIAYLESSSKDNIPIYNKFGFQFYEDIMLGSDKAPGAREGEDYAVMNVMIRGPFGAPWSLPNSKL